MAFRCLIERLDGLALLKEVAYAVLHRLPAATVTIYG